MHISNEMSWRGGENQVRLLIAGLRAYGVDSVLAFPQKSEAHLRLSSTVEAVPLASRSPLDPRTIFRLIQYCRRNHVDILNAHSSGGMSLALAIKMFLPHLGLVVHKRTAFPISKKWSSRRKYMSPLVDGYVCISKAISKILIEYGISSEKVSTVLSAIDSDRYSVPQILKDRAAWRAKLAVLDSDIVIACASALTSEKGHDTLLAACKTLKGFNVRFRCLIAGTGPLDSSLKQWVLDHGLEKQVNFLGFVADIPDFLPVADILVLPSRAEGLGTILLEAAMARCALVGSNVGGIPEVIMDGETGFLFNPDDSIKLAERLKELCEEPQLRLRLTQKSYEHVVQNFSLEKMVRDNFALYKRTFHKLSN